MSDTLTPEQIREMVRQNPSRLVHYLHCLDCLFEWKAPVAMGLCPKCRSENTECETVAPCIEKRL